LPPDKRARLTSTRRPGGAVVPPAQRRRRQQATARATSDRGQAAGSHPAPPRFTRDRLLGWGAGTCAILTLVSLATISDVVLIMGLMYFAFALVGTANKRDRRLSQAAWTFALLLVLSAGLATYYAVGLSHADPGDVDSLAYLSMGAATMGLSIASQVLLAVASVLAGWAFGKQGDGRSRLLSWSGVSLIFYCILLLPTAVVESPAPPPLGSFWTEPSLYGGLLMALLSGTAIVCAFLWTQTSGEDDARGGPPRISYAQREYMLFVAAASLLLWRLTLLLATDWSLLRLRTHQSASGAVLIILASLLPLLLLFAFATAAFWTSCRRTGWKPTRWLTAPVSDTPVHGAAAWRAEAAGAGLGPRRRGALDWGQRFFLTWRLPLFYAWLLLVIAACSFLGWYGFFAAVPAAVHYLWMSMRDRSGAHRAAAG
jgi:hypothetical protein